jgi:hypothetical protein
MRRLVYLHCVGLRSSFVEGYSCTELFGQLPRCEISSEISAEAQYLRKKEF